MKLIKKKKSREFSAKYNISFYAFGLYCFYFQHSWAATTQISWYLYVHLIYGRWCNPRRRTNLIYWLAAARHHVMKKLYLDSIHSPWTSPSVINSTVYRNKNKFLEILLQSGQDLAQFVNFVYILNLVVTMSDDGVSKVGSLKRFVMHRQCIYRVLIREDISTKWKTQRDILAIFVLCSDDGK